MALIRCKECAGAVSTTAKVCPHCGAAVKLAGRSILWLIIPLVVGPMLIVAGYQALRSPEDRAAAEARRAADTAEVQRKAEEAGVITGSQANVRRLLKDPDSAVFRAVVLRRAAGLEHGAVCGYVNAKNSFGAMTGERPFVVVDGVPYLQGQAESFDGTWAAYCRG